VRLVARIDCSFPSGEILELAGTDLEGAEAGEGTPAGDQVPRHPPFSLYINEKSLEILISFSR
jgi:hypothetical protein